MNKDEFLRLFEKTLEIEKNLNGDEELSSIDGWDSMAVLGLIAIVDSKLQKEFDPASLSTTITVNDIWELINELQNS